MDLGLFIKDTCDFAVECLFSFGGWEVVCLIWLFIRAVVCSLVWCFCDFTWVDRWVWIVFL